MQSFKLVFSILITCLIVSCSNPLDKPLGADGLEAATQEISSMQELSEMKKKYVIDNMSMIAGFFELGKAATGEKAEDTFRDEFERLSSDYDSIYNAKLEAQKSNTMLDNFISVVDAKATIIDKYKGYLTMSVDFKNEFDKEILYIILNYKYIDKYDSKFFEENVKVTDAVAGDFSGVVELYTTEEYNNAASFLYSKVPVRAPKAMRDELGEEVANKKRMSDFLLEGLQVKATLIVFTDKSEIEYQNAEWEYLDN